MFVEVYDLGRSEIGSRASLTTAEAEVCNFRVDAAIRGYVNVACRFDVQPSIMHFETSMDY